ncbi:hypothetical protein NM208_g7305 [Fusarium decemcellulare]|uniref:Uncharacterized protein n=1 Tax=Fusarium decemcellulare TaxID=57161 RepID=A0ACC1S9U0_9HYPO|nr:hypothetical protein NM208_g7305 [Fusarium decemcellulare]
MVPPQVDIPNSNSTVSVSIIDTTSWAYRIPCHDFFRPPFEGLDSFDLCSYAFLITRRDKHGERHVLFDLGIRKDWENLVPDMVESLKKWGTTVKVDKAVVDILRDGGTDLNKIDAIIWSHLHWDHTGNLASFPSSAALVVGPGINSRFMPGWPTVSDADFRETDVEGREIIGLEEASFSIDIGGLNGYDYFGDGSFYLLNAPGHSTGHLNALARTSNDPPTFVFMAADSVHLAGEFRPSEDLPLPDLVDVPGIDPRPCSYERLLAIHPRGSRTLPYLGLAPCFPESLEDAERTIKSIERLDADERVLVVFSHDVSMYKTLEYYPATADGWKDKGWKSTGRWAFLADLQQIARSREPKRTGCVMSQPAFMALSVIPFGTRACEPCRLKYVPPRSLHLRTSLGKPQTCPSFKFADLPCPVLTKSGNISSLASCNMLATKPQQPSAVLADVSVDEAIRSRLSGEYDRVECTYLGDSDWSWPLKVSLIKENEVIKSYFVKLAKSQLGMSMLRGEYESMLLLHSIVPNYSAQPVGWGTCSSEPDHYFYISDYHDLVSQQPEVKSLCAITAQFHNDSANLLEKGQVHPKPGGRFGFHVATHMGKFPQDNAWSDSWDEFYKRGMHRILTYESKTQGPSEELDSLAPELLNTVIPRLLRPLDICGRRIRPVLIHGDLQIRNVKMDKDTHSLFLIDAGSFWGHNECEIGKWRPVRFQIGQEYVEEYHKLIPKADPIDEWEDRNILYSIRFNLISSAHYAGDSSSRQLALNDIRYLVEKYGHVQHRDGAGTSDTEPRSSNLPVL